jgi:hypothetical protein
MIATRHNNQVTALALASLKLPFRFDPELLRRDLTTVPADAWSPHYNERDFGGNWQGVALRSPNGSAHNLFAGPPGISPFSDTPLLANCPYFQEILALFDCPLKSVRLLSLAPGSFIKEHSDNALGFEEGEVRLHIPIETNPGVEFYVCGERLLLEEANCYYVNVNLPHRVNNRGAAARIHLVIDAVVNDWVRELFAESADIPRSSLPPTGFDDFARLVCADPALRESLRATPDRATLLNAVVRESAARGFDLNEADIEAAFRASATGAPAADPGWLPTRITFRNGQPWATWIYAPGQRFTEPFFDEQLRICQRDTFTALFRREIPLGPLPAVRPAGFIFHMSRCGSTLISRSFAAAESTLVLSEPAPLDDIVQTKRADWLAWIVAALGNARSAEQTRYVIKLDAWHIRSLPLFRQVFPDVPCIFVYRDPLEVLVSHVRQPGMQSSPGALDPAILGMSFADITTLSRRQWCVRVLRGFLESALEFRDDPKGMFVDYSELPGAIRGKIARHFGMDFSPEDEARVQAATSRNAKNPQADFEDDRAAKQKEAESLLAEPGIETLRALFYLCRSNNTAVLS